MALVAYNVLSCVRAALRSVHGTGKIEAGISNYYLADEIEATYRGMMIAIPPSEWQIFHFYDPGTSLCHPQRTGKQNAA